MADAEKKDTPNPSIGPQPGQTPNGGASHRGPLWPWIVGGATVPIFTAIVFYIIFFPHAHQTTDDAYVTAHFATVAPRVPGQVTRVLVEDNQPVRAGQLLVTIDERDYRAALDQALAGPPQPPIIVQAESQVSSATAKLSLSRTDAQRYANLAVTGAGTAQQAQQASVTRDQDLASLASAQAERAAQVLQLEALQASLATATAKMAADEAQVA